MEKVGEKSPDLSHDRLPDLVSRIMTVIFLIALKNEAKLAGHCEGRGPSYTIHIKHWVWCRWDIGPLYDPPLGPRFKGQSIIPIILVEEG